VPGVLNRTVTPSFVNAAPNWRRGNVALATISVDSAVRAARHSRHRPPAPT
jgi:hypothetical protein